MLRTVIGLVILTACVAQPCSGAPTALSPAANEARKLLDEAVAKELKQEYRSWGATRARGWEAVKAKEGALKRLAEIAADAETSTEARWMALGIIAEEDKEGAEAEAVLATIKDGPAFPQERWGTCWERAAADVEGYLFRALKGPKSVERVVDAILANNQTAYMLIGRVVGELPMKTRVAACLLMLDHAEDQNVMMNVLGHVSYYLDGPAVREKLLQIASDEKRDDNTRRQASCAWASRCTKADYDRAEKLLRSVVPWKDGPPEDHVRALAALDWKRASDALNEHWKTKPPTSYQSSLVRDFADEKRVLDMLAEAAGQIKDDNPNVARQAMQTLGSFGSRDAADIINLDDFARNYSALQTCFNLGIDPTPMLRHAVDFSPAEDILRVSGSSDVLRYLPAAARKECGGLFVAVALRVIAQYPTDREDLVEWEKQELRDAFSTLCFFAPDKAEPYIERFAKKSRLTAAALLTTPAAKAALVRIFREELPKDDPADDDWNAANVAESLLVAGGAEQAPFIMEATKSLSPARRFRVMQVVADVDPALACGEFLRLLAAEGDTPRAVEIAMSIVRTGEALTDDQRKLVDAPIFEAMQNSAGAPRLDYAMLLAVDGNAAGRELVEGFLSGSWRPQTNYWSAFSGFARVAMRPETPALARWKSFVLRGVTEPQDPAVRAALLSGTRGFLGVREGDAYPIVESALLDLGPDGDWRLRQQSALALRLAFRDVRPDWDYGHFWPVERRKQAADDIRKWWRENKDRLRWVAGPGPFRTIGAFAFQP